MCAFHASQSWHTKHPEFVASGAHTRIERKTEGEKSHVDPVTTRK